MRWTDLAKRYLGALASKDLGDIESLLSDNVRMMNWSCNVNGKKETLSAISNVFDFVNNVKIHIENTAYNNKYVCMEVRVIYTRDNSSSKSKIVVSYMVYILEFDDWGKIKVIRIYRMKERED